MASPTGAAKKPKPTTPAVVTFLSDTSEGEALLSITNLDFKVRYLVTINYDASPLIKQYYNVRSDENGVVSFTHQVLAPDDVTVDIDLAPEGSFDAGPPPVPYPRPGGPPRVKRGRSP